MEHLYMHQPHHKHSKYDYKVCNYQGDVIYFIKGRWGKLEDRVILYDLYGQEIYRATQVLLSILPKFELSFDGDFIGNITKHIRFNQTYFTVSHLGWVIHGNFEKKEYNISKHGRKLAYIQKSVAYKGDYFFISFSEPKYKGLYCLLATLLDHYAPDYLKTNPIRLVRGDQNRSFLFFNSHSQKLLDCKIKDL